MLPWLRRSFIAGFFVTVPLFITVAAFIWLFGIVDGLTGPFYQRLLGRQVPGLGILTTALGVLFVGAFATNVIGRRILLRADSYLLRVPVFRTIYAPVKQLVVAFSPDNEFGFKRVVLVRDGDRVLARISHEGIHRRPGAWRGADGGRVRADQPPVSGRHRDLRAGEGQLSGHHRPGGSSHLPDRGDGAAGANPRRGRKRPHTGLPSIIRRFLLTG